MTCEAFWWLLLAFLRFGRDAAYVRPTPGTPSAIFEPLLPLPILGTLTVLTNPGNTVYNLILALSKKGNLAKFFVDQEALTRVYKFTIHLAPILQARRPSVAHTFSDTCW